MSAVIRDPGGTVRAEPVLRRPAGGHVWPDPRELAPPPVQSPAPRETDLPLAARWPVSPPPGAWPPLAGTSPEPPADRPPARAPRPRPAPFAVDDQGALAMPGFLEPDLPPAPPSVATLEWRASAPRHAPAEAAAVPARHADPSPSRLAYRLQRLWLTPAVRHFLRVGLPVILMLALVLGFLADADRRAAIGGAVQSVRTAIENRPAFQVSALHIESRSPEVAQGVELLLGLSFPVSSLQLDMTDLRRRAEALDAVERASVMVRGGVLEVRLIERVPAMVWRHSGGLDLVDERGHRIARLAARAARPDLPLIAGDGAPAAIAEARLLWAAALPLRERVRGLVRVGERRWDLVLDRGQVIQLPAQGALGALERALALHGAQGLLDRDLTVVDLRNPARPTLRLSAGALDELNRIRRESSGARER